ncbi:MAG: DUF3144 domain-containing protein [Wenzhouxiangellaceae bacterium]|nr:DUF3144 domain-containing protein [Wenzhouxiangellaceae bacterium]
MNEQQQRQLQAHNRATSAFIDLANELAKQEDQDPRIVSAALMAASGIYATFTTAGNQGFLAPGGVEKVAEMYKNNLGYIQERKKEELKAQGLEPKPLGGDGTIASPHAAAIADAEKKPADND